MTEWMSERRPGMFNVTQGKYAEEVARQTRAMGPIETELRNATGFLWSVRISDAALNMTIETAAQMGCESLFLNSNTLDAEVLSEAIEAAEALGL